jgi:hypothetical protein
LRYTYLWREGPVRRLYVLGAVRRPLRWDEECNPVSIAACKFGLSMYVETNKEQEVRGDVADLEA